MIFFLKKKRYTTDETHLYLGTSKLINIALVLSVNRTFYTHSKMVIIKEIPS